MFKVWARIIQKGALLTGRPDEIVRQNQLAAMHEATQFGTRRVKERTPQGVFGAQGGLLASIEPEVRETARGGVGLIATSHRYGLVVEVGRKPGGKMPPGGKGAKRRPIRAWIRVKMGVSLKEANRIEFLVRRKIAKEGTEGAFMFRDTLDEDWPDFQNIFERYGVKIGRALER